MSPKEPAERKLERVLALLALAAREGGASLAELAEELGVSEDRVVRDLEEVAGIAYHLPPERFPDLEIAFEADRVSVWTKGAFRRPVRLTPPEALALTLGLRLLASAEDEDRARSLDALAARMDRDLAVPPAEPLGRWTIEAGDRDGEGLLALLRDAARARLRCELRYLKGGADEPEDRVLEPYALVYAGGAWYALGRSPERDGIRAFRLDRILEAEVGEDGFDVPADFDAADYVDGEILFFTGDEPMTARVWYSARIARWIEEWAPEVEHDGDGVIVAHRVADPAWIVRHALRYGRDAEVLGPPEARALVAGRLAAMGAGPATRPDGT